MIRSRALLLAAALVAAAACRPKPAPAGGDSTAADTAARADSLRPDSVRLDTGATATVSDAELWGEPAPELTAADTLARPRAGLRALPSSEGMPFGLSTYLPTSRWCNGTMFNSTIVAGTPQLIPGIVRLGIRCHTEPAFTIRRPDMTCNGQPTGLFCPDRARAADDAVAAAIATLTPDERRQIQYVSALDDMGSAESWGGRPVTGEQTRDQACYLASKLQPLGVAVGLRVGTDWMARQRGVDWRGCVTVITAQYTTSKPGTQTQWYQRQVDLAPQVGVKRIIVAVNVHYCGGNQDPRPCSADELRQFVGTALNFAPWMNCGFIGWKYDEREVAARSAVYYDLAKIAKAHTSNPTCFVGS
jgi:hypothetical protein